MYFNNDTFHVAQKGQKIFGLLLPENLQPKIAQYFKKIAQYFKKLPNLVTLWQSSRPSTQNRLTDLQTHKRSSNIKSSEMRYEGTLL